MSKPRNNLIGHTIFLTSEKYRMLLVIGRCFSLLFAASPDSIMVSRFADIVSVEQFIENSTECCFAKEFLTLKNESRLMEEISPKELNAYISEFIITVRKKDNNEDYEPSSLRSSGVL